MHSKTDSLQNLAQILRKAQASKTPCAPIRHAIGVDDIDLAYQIQEINTKERVAEGAKIVGYKIGLTSNAIQNQLGVDAPDFGILYDDREILNGGSLPANEILQPRIETEIAFVLGTDLNQNTINTTDLISAIDYALISLEIVGSRIENWDIKITDTVADNASASHFVLGHKPMPLHAFDVVSCEMTMHKNGELVSQGSGAACLGSPINAALWLAKKFTGLGRPLKKGDLILTGAVGPMVAVNAGDQFEASIDGLGSVSVNFT